MNEYNFQHEGLRLTVTQLKDGFTIAWSGVSDSRSPGDFINPITQRLVKQVRGREITIDVSALEFMNSATVGPLISSVKAFEAAGKEVLVIFSNADWQRVHAQCTRTIAKTMSSVRVMIKS